MVTPTTPATPPRPPIPPNQLIPLDDIRVRFAWLWLPGFAATFIILAVQTLIHSYRYTNDKAAVIDKTSEVWGWYLPTMLPSLGLIITVLTYTALDPLMTGSLVRKSFTQIAFWLSAFYLLTVLLTILIAPVAAKDVEDAVATMRSSNIFLGPFQSLVASAIGILFVTKEKHP